MKITLLIAFVGLCGDLLAIDPTEIERIPVSTGKALVIRGFVEEREMSVKVGNAPATKVRQNVNVAKVGMESGGTVTREAELGDALSHEKPDFGFVRCLAHKITDAYVIILVNDRTMPKLIIYDVNSTAQPRIVLYPDGIRLADYAPVAGELEVLPATPNEVRVTTQDIRRRTTKRVALNTGTLIE